VPTEAFPRRPPGEGRALQLVYYGYVVASRVAPALPERPAYALAEGLGRARARLTRRRPAAVRRNLARITGRSLDARELDAMVREVYASYARYWLETFRLVRQGPEFFLERVECTTLHRLDDVLSKHGGAILVAGHLGNWDAVGAWGAVRGYRVVAIAELLRPRRMFEFFKKHRSRLGMTIYPAEKGALRRLAEEVRAGAVVAIVGDKDSKGRGREVSFFGERVRFATGPAMLAARTGVPLLVAGVYGITRANGLRGWTIEIAEPIPVPKDDPHLLTTLTQEVARKLEGFVARSPTEWHIMDDYWATDRRAP
jgi:phosphatidylinositol dimannoside acyltransferase